MKFENILLIGGLGVIAYILLMGDKKNRAIQSAKKEEQNNPSNTKTTIVRTTVFVDDRRSSLFPEAIYKRYDSSKMATVAPAKATVTI
ncbi:MAG: hypothetical protein LLF94_10855 [Chlamydiales bacterium]|nr:hypothetical protein [Chlamydiales bacterium]